ESGFRPEPLPLLLPHRQPSSPAQKEARRAEPLNSKHWLTTTEPVYITTIPVPSHGRHPGYEYTCFWYAASLPPDAVRETDTGMEDEKNYIGKLLHVNEALQLLRDSEAYVLWFTYKTWEQTCQTLEEDEKEAQPTPRGAKEGQTGSLSTSSDLMSSMV
ncbi:7231_t:CDS:1, partial [Acaulospora colombiana]